MGLSDKEELKELTDVEIVRNAIFADRFCELFNTMMVLNDLAEARVTVNEAISRIGENVIRNFAVMVIESFASASEMAKQSRLIILDPRAQRENMDKQNRKN